MRKNYLKNFFWRIFMENFILENTADYEICSPSEEQLASVSGGMGMNVKGWVRYVIRYGDTLTKIAKVFHSSIEAICIVNGIANPNVIKAGATLIIPVLW